MPRRSPGWNPKPKRPPIDAAHPDELREGGYFVQPGNCPHTGGPIYGRVVRWSWDDNEVVFDTIYNRDMDGSGPDVHHERTDFGGFSGQHMRQWYDHDQLPQPLMPKSRRGLDITRPPREKRW